MLQYVAVCCRQCFVAVGVAAIAGHALTCLADVSFMLKYVAVSCSTLQCVAVCCSMLQYVAVCCSMLKYIAVCCSMLQYVADNVTLQTTSCCSGCCSARTTHPYMPGSCVCVLLQWVLQRSQNTLHNSREWQSCQRCSSRCILQCVEVCCSVLQCIVLCCSVGQCVAVCGSVLQCVAVRCSVLP